MVNVADIATGLNFGFPPSDWDRDLRSVVEVMTPKRARELRDTAHFERQRKISKANIDRLATEMRAGRFIPGTQIYIVVLPDGTQLIMNGNHTLEATAASGIPQIVTLTYKRVRDVEEAGRIYAVFDIHKARSWVDSLRATGQENAVEMASYVLAAIGVIDTKFAHDSAKFSAGSRLERLDRMEEYKESAAMLSSLMAGAPNNSAKLVRRAAVMAVALETIRYQPSAGAEFWYRLVQDNGLSAGMPERALLSWLRNFRGGTGQGARRDTCRACAAAWNAAFKSEPRDYVKPNAMGSFFLLGTPWSHGISG